MATPRQKLRAERLAAARRVPTIKVYASSPEVHAILRHPSGMGLRGDFGSGTDWPHDAFTNGLLRKGTLALAAAPKERPKPDPKLNARQRAALRRPKPGEIPPVRTGGTAAKAEEPKADAAKADAKAADTKPPAPKQPAPAA